MSHAQTFAEPARFDHWRSLPVGDALALANHPGWADEVDDSGRNLLMQACAFFANPAVLDALFTVAAEQGVLARMCAHEDAIGIRLAAYALHHLHKEWLPQQVHRAVLFARGGVNNAGHGLLRQLLDLSRAEDPEEALPSLTVRNVGFSFEDLKTLTVEDWQAGLAGHDEVLLAWWFGRVLENETGFGVVFTDDLEAVLAWLLPLFEATDRAQWSEPLGQCLEAVRVLQRLRNTREEDPPAVAMQILRESRQDLLAHRNRWGPRFLLDVLLFYQHQEGTWQAFVDGDDLDHGTDAAQQEGALRRL